MQFFPAWAYTVPGAILRLPFSVVDATIFTLIVYFPTGTWATLVACLCGPHNRIIKLVRGRPWGPVAADPIHIVRQRPPLLSGWVHARHFSPLILNMVSVHPPLHCPPPLTAGLAPTASRFFIFWGFFILSSQVWDGCETCMHAWM